MQDTQKTSYLQDTNVYIYENKLAVDMKLVTRLEIYSSFLY